MVERVVEPPYWPPTVSILTTVASVCGIRSDESSRKAFSPRATLVLLCALVVVDFADRQVVVTTFPYLRAEWGLSEAQLGALASAVSVVVALGTFPVALVVDRWGRARAIAVMGVVWSGATAACAFAPGYLALLTARIGIGAGQAGFAPAGAAVLGATFRRERRATALAVFQAGAPVGLVAGAVVGSLFAARWGWRSAFLAVVVPGLILALLALRLRDYRSDPQPSRGRVAAAMLLRARSGLAAMLGGALLLVIFSTLYTWLPTHLEHAYGMPPTRANVLASTVVLAGAGGTALSGLVADRLARRDVRWRLLVPALGAVATTATLGTAFVATPPGPTQLLLVLLGGALATTAVGPASAVIIDVVSLGVRATAVSIFASAQNLMGLAVGPVLTGVLADRWGLTTALSTVAGLGVAAGVAFWWGSYSYGQDRARVAPMTSPDTASPLPDTLATRVRPGLGSWIRPSEGPMRFTQYYLDCLSQASYLMGDEASGQAVVVDPRRDVGEYLADTRHHGLRIVGVVNTHFHADFLAGHLELAAATGAWVGYGSRAVADYPIRNLGDGERIALGDVTLEIWETPGHTPESISVLVYEHAADTVPYGVLTGDALFIGDVGRPDLLASLGATSDELARMLHRSINRLMTLPDEVRVFPAHGAGSACGKNLSTERQSTIGEQRATNYACRPMSKDDFVALVTEGQAAAPEYFGYDAVLNRRRHAVFDAVSPPTPLEIDEALTRQAAGAVVLDAREPHEFAVGHLRGSLNVPAGGRFAETAGTVVHADQEVVLVAPQDREEELVVRLGRIGFDRVAGYLRAPVASFLAVPDRVDRASRLTAPALVAALNGPNPPVLIDVRKAGEVAGGAIPGARHIALAELPRRLAEIPPGRPVVTYCASGYRSSVAASLLRHADRHDVSDLLGGYAAWSAADTGEPRDPADAPP
jgi:hydroxyacylglutathione hydrolase